MKQDALQAAEKYTKAHQRKKRWYRGVIGLACVVVFCTVYALILPAITMEKGACKIPEHTHSEACYTQVTSVTRTKQVCTIESLNLHQHDETCYDSEGNLTCGYADLVVHRHDSDCYDEEENLRCLLPEVEAHVHTESCYAEPVGEAEAAEPELICNQTEVILHEHTSDCFDDAGALICGKIQVLEHQHTDACFETVAEPVDTTALTCTLPEDENHTHTALCYGIWELTCGMEEHTHSEECQPEGLTEEEQARVDAVIARIEALPTSEEVEETLAAYDRTENPQGYNACLQALQAQVKEAGEAYDSLAESEKTHVTNADKLNTLEWLLGEAAVNDAPALSGDDAYVSTLTMTGAESAAAGVMTVCSGDTITYSFLVRTESYTDACFGQGRVRLEFVLPLSEEQAAFDLSTMTWLDGSEGYAPTLTTQLREIDGRETLCQVLTGYKLLSARGQGNSAIPGEFTGTVPVTVLDMTQGEGVALQISAAMEHSAWEGECETHLTEEKLTVATETYTVITALSAEEQQAVYEQFLAEAGALDGQSDGKAEELLQRLQEAYQQGQLTDEGYTELYEQVYTLLYGDVNTIAEAAEGTNWILLRDSGWFEAYSHSASRSAFLSGTAFASSAAAVMAYADDIDTYTVPPSDVQVTNRGGTNTSEDGAVSVSKTISGTDLENVFDITLQVQTSMNVAEIIEEPDMAVVIVMDISNTMNSNFGGVTRYEAAMTAAENFLEQFAGQNTLGISKVGYVAFNTDAHQIFGLQSCATLEQANDLKNTMRTQTGSIINASGYDASHSRFTNVEAGLAMAADMLNGVSNENKFIIFLSDGFPTTYIKSGYSGYDPYDSTGRFYDHVLNKPCLYGTSYSDKAAIRARDKAAAIKSSGVTIFSIGVDVAGQTIQKYITQSENASGFSVVDRTGTTYEIGDASSTEAYKNWLRNSIGSGYYYDSTNSAGLSSAYNQIFEEIKHQVETGSQADWVAEDPLPTIGGSTETVEFIGFYDKTPTLVGGQLSGEHKTNGENAAAFNGEKSTINWDLKQSGYQMASNGGTTTYTYTLVYRVRLKNENSGFVEGTVYPTNDTTTLQYRTIENIDYNLTVSDPKTINFPIPSVKGYLSELTFTKVDSREQPLAGAAFTLSHDTKHCSVCRGDGTGVTIEDMTATSNANGTVSFTNIPSGHKYTLTETKVPDGYSANGNTYAVEVAYDKITVTVTTIGGNPVDWTGTVVNQTYYELPNTGGAGTVPYTVGGFLLLTGAAFLLLYIHIRRRKEDSASS